MTPAFFIDKMMAHDRNYYSYPAAEAIINYYDELDENYEFDPIAISCEWTEYAYIDDIRSDYGRQFDEEIEEDDDDFIDSLRKETTVLKLSNGHWLVQAC